MAGLPVLRRFIANIYKFWIEFGDKTTRPGNTAVVGRCNLEVGIMTWLSDNMRVARFGSPFKAKRQRKTTYLIWQKKHL